MKLASTILLIIGLSTIGYVVKANAAFPECTAIHTLSQSELIECKTKVDSDIKQRAKEIIDLQEKSELDTIRLRIINRRITDFQKAQ